MSYGELTTASLDDIYKEGYARGSNIATWVDMPAAGDTVRVDGDRIEVIDATSLEEAMRGIAYSSEDNSRSYSPFEFIAHAMNERADSEEAWNRYQAGIDAGINDGIEKRIAAVADTWFEDEE